MVIVMATLEYVGNYASTFFIVPRTLPRIRWRFRQDRAQDIFFSVPDPDQDIFSSPVPGPSPKELFFSRVLRCQVVIKSPPRRNMKMKFGPGAQNFGSQQDFFPQKFLENSIQTRFPHFVFSVAGPINFVFKIFFEPGSYQFFSGSGPGPTIFFSGSEPGTMDFFLTWAQSFFFRVGVRAQLVFFFRNHFRSCFRNQLRNHFRTNFNHFSQTFKPEYFRNQLR